jgi:hypothetical protein
MNLCCGGLALGARVAALARIAHPPDEAGHAVEEREGEASEVRIFMGFLTKACSMVVHCGGRLIRN